MSPSRELSSDVVVFDYCLLDIHDHTWQFFMGVLTPCLNLFFLNLNILRLSRMCQEDSGLTERKGGQGNQSVRVWG